MNIYILRHGQTEWNIEKRFQGQLDSKLTELGKKEIEQTAKKIENIKFDVVYTSEMLRAVNTAKIIVENNFYNENTVIEKMKEFNEIYFGDWQGLTYKEICEKDEQNINNYFNDPKKYDARKNNAETLENGLERFLRGMKKVAIENEKNENILIVTHGTIIELFLNYVKGKNVSDIDERILMGNAEYKIYNYKNGKFIEKK